MSDSAQVASLYRLLTTVDEWEITCRGVDGTPHYRNLKAGIGLIPSLFDRSEALAEMGYKVASEAEWSWRETVLSSREPGELIGHVLIVPSGVQGER